MLRLEAARRAAADARRKAEAYCEGIGAKVGRIIRLTEPGERHAGAVAPSASVRLREPMPVEAGEHEITASIQATFLLDLGLAALDIFR
jgi:uncharacterized protein YggE